MPGNLYSFMAGDHDRLDALLTRATARTGVIDMGPFSEFRKGLLGHIAMEEKVILPTIARFQNGKQAEVAARLRRDHGAIVALLVPPPTASIVATLVSILDGHNALEEEDGGLYQLLQRLARDEQDTVLEKMIAAREVRVLPHNTRPDIIEATRRAVERAGYEFKEVL